MVNDDFTQLENALIDAGRAIDYPRTPNLAVRVRAELQADRSRRPGRLRWRPVLIVAAAIVAVLALLLVIPETREVIAQWLGLKTIRIIETTPAPTPVNATPAPTPTPGVVPFKQCCPSTLEEARKRAHFKILLPPDEQPSRVFFQDRFFGLGNDAQQLVLVFGPPDRPRFVLYEAQWWVYEKMINGGGPEHGVTISETLVNGQRALWLSGAPHILITLDQRGNPIFDTERPVNANTLIWEARGPDTETTYRLETSLSLEEAIRFAESLK